MWVCLSHAASTPGEYGKHSSTLSGRTVATGRRASRCIAAATKGDDGTGSFRVDPVKLVVAEQPATPTSCFSFISLRQAVDYISSVLRRQVLRRSNIEGELGDLKIDACTAETPEAALAEVSVSLASPICARRRGGLLRSLFAPLRRLRCPTRSMLLTSELWPRPRVEPTRLEQLENAASHAEAAALVLRPVEDVSTSTCRRTFRRRLGAVALAAPALLLVPACSACDSAQLIAGGAAVAPLVGAMGLAVASRCAGSRGH